MTVVRLSREPTKDETIMNYWIIETIGMRLDIKKEELDKIIEAKNVPTREAMIERVREFL